ncbi:aminotransferase class III-fold pyridoxal phosphate-dependent enzyme [Candidatus Nitrosotalea okcheonensis]|uniref:Aminotransferase class-III n=1 Tax=Candidatus Nitrosotalea okcheonensis TaxID=1903276 RepID=A0A2H1FHR7_9ARCH|nr:aminotransferase class III-fold pyridoxal phosphate-dependent enzyme [Candidatus Nitrosotalea okcheonensis]SMH72308.1 Aminotransferase class-III [Candidatus Nitrosotalea okcheonensis]
MLNLKKSNEYLKRATGLIPALSQTFSKAPYSYVKGIYPVYLKSGKGSHVFDVDNNEFIDYILALGPVTLGYAYQAVDNAISQQLKKGISFSMPHHLEVELSEEIHHLIPGADMVRFSKTGSDAVTAAVRAARAITKKDNILYCGSGGVWHDWFTVITSRSEGIPYIMKSMIRKFNYNDLESLKISFEESNDNVAAVCMEPLMLENPRDDFLQKVKKITHDNNAVLIFDEVVTGFRYAKGGAQEYLGVEGDIVAFGKGIANGMPLGAITGKEEYMKKFDEVFYSTSYGGETLSLAASLAVINEIKNKPVIEHCWNIGRALIEGFNKIASELSLDIEISGFPIRGSIVCRDENGNPSNLLKSILLQELVERGIMFGPGAVFVSYSHTKDDIENTLKSCREAMLTLKKGIENGNVSSLLKGEEMKKVMTF